MTTNANNRPVWERPWLLALAFVAVAFVAYHPVWHAGFIWDDDDHLTANPAMTAPHGLRMIWSSLAVSRYYPLTLTSFWVQRRLWGLNPMPYHLVNIAIHAANGFLVFLVIRRLRVPAAWLAALLWLLHPVNVESVAWVTELKNTQSGFFFFCALLCFLRFEAQGQRRWYALALLCGAGAVLSKPSTVVLPLVLLLCTRWERGRWRWPDIVRVAPFFALSAFMSALTIVEQRGRIVREGPSEWSLGVVERAIVAGKAIWFYLGKILWPANLAFVYPRWETTAISAKSWLPLAGVVTCGIVLWTWRRQPWARAGLFWFGFFLTALLPVLGFVDVYYFRYSFVADHFQYLASLGVIAYAAVGMAHILGRSKLWSAPAGNAICSALAVVLACLTWGQASIYRDSETLWRDTLAKNPNAWMAHNNLGIVLVEAGRREEAITHWEEALRIKPDYADAHNNLGIALWQAGRTQKAIEHWEEAVRLKPDFAKALNNLGVALSQTGGIQKAIQCYELALRIRPDYAEAHYNLGSALEQTGRLNDAIKHYEETLRLKPDSNEVRRRIERLRAGQ